MIRAHLGAELLVEGERWPVVVWTVDHPAGLVLVDTGMIDTRPEIDDMSPTPHPENIPRDVACLINTHLHFDHCGGNRLFPGVPIHRPFVLGYARDAYSTLANGQSVSSHSLTASQSWVSRCALLARTQESARAS